MPTPLRELLAYFDIDVDSKKLEDADKKVEGFTEKLKKVAEVVAEAFALDKLKDFFGEQIRGAAQLQTLSERLGLAAHELEAFRFAAGTAGIDAEQAAHSLGFLNRTIGGALSGNKEAAKAFAQLGIQIREGTRVKDLNELLPELADAFAKLGTDPRRAALAVQLFGRQGQALLPLLSQGREKLEELRKESEELGSGLSDDYPRDAKKAAEALFKLHYAFDSLKQRITAAALPALMRIFEALKRGVVDIIDFTKKTNILTTGMAFLATVASAKLVISLIKLAKTFGLVKEGVLETVAAFLKFAGPTTILGALYLVLDDIYTWATGGQSLIGETLEKFEGAKAATDLMKDLKDTVHDLEKSLDLIPGTLTSLQKTAAIVFPAIGQLILGTVRSALAMFHTLKMLANIMGDLATAATAGNVPEEMHALRDIVKQLGEGGAAIERDLPWYRKLLERLGIEKPAGEPGPETPGPMERTGTGTRVPEVSVNSVRRAHQAINATAGGAAASTPTIAPAAASSTIVHFNQENNLDVKVQGGARPEQTGRAVGQGAMTEAQKQANNALNAILAP